MLAISTQPESNLAILGRSIRLYFASFIRVIPLAFLLSVIVFIPEIFSSVFNQEIFSPLLSIESFWSLFFDLIIVFVYLAILWRMRGSVYEAHESVKEDVEQASRKYLRVVIAGVIVTFILGLIAFTTMTLYSVLFKMNIIMEPNYIGMVILSVISFIYAGIVTYLYFVFYFYMPLILMENAGIFASLITSFRLVYHHWWRVFFLQITPGLTFFVLLVVIRYVFNWQVNIFLIPGPEQNTFAVYALNIVVFALFIPWIAAILLLQLHDLELRKHYTIRK